GNTNGVFSANTFTDTLGATVLTISGSGTSASPRVYTYIDSNGTSRTVTVSYADHTIETNFGCAGVNEYGANPNQPLVDRVTYPDGSFYSFTYEVTPGHSS